MGEGVEQGRGSGAAHAAQRGFVHLFGDVAHFFPLHEFAAAGLFQFLSENGRACAAGGALAAGFGGKALMVLPQRPDKARRAGKHQETPVAEENFRGIPLVELIEKFQRQVFGSGGSRGSAVVVHDIVPDSVNQLRHRAKPPWWCGVNGRRKRSIFRLSSTLYSDYRVYVGKKAIFVKSRNAAGVNGPEKDGGADAGRRCFLRRRGRKRPVRAAKGAAQSMEGMRVSEKARR